MARISDIENVDADYIIVGGGTSGLVVGTRLTEDATNKVLVLEAGESLLSDPRVDIPAFWSSLLDTDMDWAFASTPQQDLSGRVQKLPQGKGLGGSSALNGQALAGPSQAGIDAWELLGNPGWNWATLAQYYRKMFTLHLPDDAAQRHLGLDWIDMNVNGSSGPIQASLAGSGSNTLNKAWVDAFDSLDFSTNGDPFSGHSIGGYSSISSIDPRTKTRSYAANAYATPVKSHVNLKIATGAMVERINFNSHNDQVIATSVLVAFDGGKRRVTLNAAREVILAAGVFATPKLLELSGIGHKPRIERYGIDTVVENQFVGENLQDHLLTGISYEVNDGIETIDPLMRREPEAMRDAQELYRRGEGPFCTGGVTSHSYMTVLSFSGAGGAIQRKDFLAPYSATQKSAEEEIIVDMIASGTEATGALCLLQGQGLSHENEATIDRPAKYQPGNFISIGSIQTHPLSRGSTHITSSDPLTKPEINHCYFSHPVDLEIMARHVLDCEKLRNTPALSQVLKPNRRRNHQRAHVKTIEDAKQYLAETARTAHHSCGTCAMKPREHGGVVDASLKVYGVSNLRIVDASVFPLISRGNTMSTVYAVAERAADIIKAEAAL